MNASWRATLWMVSDVLRQAAATSSGWLILGTVIVSTGVAVGLDATPFASSEGAPPPWASHHAIWGAWLPQTIGIFLAVFLTAGLLPSFLEPRHALVVFVKPTSRRQMVWSRVIGALMFVAGASAVYFSATWIVLGIRTGHWPISYLLAWLIFVLQFAAVYSFSAVLATATRSLGACVIGGTLFWILCFLVNLGRHALVGFHPPHFKGVTHRWIDVCYYLLPRPSDGLMLAHDALHPETLTALGELFRRLHETGEPWPAAFWLTTVVFTLVMTLVAAYELESKEY